MPDSVLHASGISNPHPALHTRKLKSAVKPKSTDLPSQIFCYLSTNSRHMLKKCSDLNLDCSYQLSISYCVHNSSERCH